MESHAGQRSIRYCRGCGMRAVIRGRIGADNFVTRVCNEFGAEFAKPMIISIRPFESVRSIDQNAKIHVMIRALAEHTGYSENEMKLIVKSQYGPYKRVYVKHKDEATTSPLSREIPKSTTEYTRPECSDFIERLYQLGAEIGCTFSETP